MKVIDLINTLDNNFVAIGTEKRISYSGKANKFESSHFLANKEVVRVVPPKMESSATIIYVN